MGNARRELESGDRVASYQLVSPIGLGGMGRVWVALDTVAPALRLVALKTALRDAPENSEFWAVLSDEAALASRIQHPNVCATYEFGDAAGTHYLVMEWSDGASLRDLLDALPNHRIEPVLAAHVIAGVAAGLHAAHELAGDDGQPLGVVHRDVSPQNVLLSSRGHVRLADFGVAKARGQAHRPTETGEVKGKLSYMAPEQVASKTIDRRADVFALGCVLYEATLGTRPFHGVDALATMYKILEQDLILPRAVDPAFPEALESVLVKALAKAPADRWATADEFREHLLKYVASTHAYVADRHTAELLDRTLGVELRQRNGAILELAQRLRKGETDPEKLRSPPPPLPQSSVTPEGGIERTISRHHTRRSKAPSRTPTLLVGAALAVAIVASIFALRSRPEPGPALSSTHAPVAAPAPSAQNSLPSPFATQPATPPSASSNPEVPANAHDERRPALRSPAKARAPVRSPAGAMPTAVPAAGASAKVTARGPRPIDHSNPFLTP